MRSVITLLLLFSGVPKKVNAQCTTINVEFRMEEKRIPINGKSYVTVKTSADDLKFQILQSKFSIPDSLRKRSQYYLINLNGYVIRFKDIPLSWNRQYPKWILTIDKVPLLEENLDKVSDAKKQGLEWINILNNGTGIDWTGFEYSKLVRLK